MKLLTTGVKNLSHGIESKGKFQKGFVKDECGSLRYVYPCSTVTVYEFKSGI